MSSLMLDYIASAIVAGLVILSIFAVQGSLLGFQRENNLSLTMNDVSAEFFRLLQEDMRAIGLNRQAQGSPLVTINSDEIEFWADPEDDGNEQRIRYRLGGTVSASNTNNPSDRILYRSVNGDAEGGASLGVTDFQLTYYDESGQQTATIADVAMIEVQMSVGTTVDLTTKLSAQQQFNEMTWRTAVAPKNLNLPPL